MSSKRDRFVTLAEKRTNNVLKQLELIGNLGNKANYEYTKNDYQQIFEVIDSEVKRMKVRFQETDNQNGTKFSLR